MDRSVVLPPDEPAGADGAKTGGWWHSIAGDRLVCDLCPRGCRLAEGQRGFCFVRQNCGGRLVSTTYGRSTGFCIDPVEKKPLNQFYPGTSILSFGTAGCNLGCKFCQNWSMSKSREVDHYSEAAAPEDIACTASQSGCKSVAFTYNDPIVWAEYAVDTARACRRLGIKTVAVTSGYISPAARETFFGAMDAANVDLKGFSEEFYGKLAAGRLEPVLDTLRWLARESDVWVEITNLVIPQANDSEEEIRRMCGWIVENLGPDVPLHFTAFHPDFKLTDRGPTPPRTLAAAHEIARQAGLHYVYTGNISDRTHQSTYCPACGRVVIERDGYHLGVYALDGDRCRHCGAAVAGRFGAAPGDWGARRQPVRIRPAPQPGPVPVSPEPPKSKGESTMANEMTLPESGPPAATRPELTDEQEALIFRTAGRRVASVVRSYRPEPTEEALGSLGGTPVFGSFVSLKRGKQLRSCCGFLGQSVSLGEALDHAAVRAACEDPRFPPISPAELDYLDMEVWLLWNCRPVPERGEERVKAIVIGKHGLQIARGQNRGLLLPGVAVEHGLDALGFLRQVCVKAGLPTDAWKDDATQLMTFEGYAIHGKLRDTAQPAGQVELEVLPGGPNRAQVTALANFCRGNLLSLMFGATPSYYLPEGYDGGVSGVVLSVRVPGFPEALECSRVGLRPDLPLQATLFELTQAAAQIVQSARPDPNKLSRIACGLTVSWDSAMHGTLDQPELAGVDPRLRAVIVMDPANWALVYDPKLAAEDLVREAAEQGRMCGSASAQVCSMAVVSTEPRLATSNAPRPLAGPAVRPPAVAGQFYPGNPAEMDQAISDMLPKQRSPEPWAGAMVPHAGWIYSGRITAATLSRTCIPSRVLLLGPRHRPSGANWAVAPHKLWALPGRNLESDPELAQRLAESVTDLAPDAEAHRAEWSLEVQLPILARLAPQTKAIGILLRGGDLPRLQRFADELAAVLRDLPERPLLVASSDMNHEADDDYTRQVDRLALDAIEALDPERLYKTVLENRITMCGVLPVVLMMETLRRLGALNRCEPVAYATSADTTGDRRRVVGYAGMLFA